MASILHNASFFLEGGFDERVKALRLEKGLIAGLLGSLPVVSPNDELVDLGGAWVYPGFIDAHTHSFSGGLYQDGVDLGNCRSVSDVLELLQAADRDGFVFAWRLDENLLREKRFPTRKELDKACPRSKLLLRRIDGHSCQLNSNALKLVPGISSPDEVLRGTDNDLAVNWLQDNCDDETILEAYHSAARVALNGGFTSIHTMIGDAEQSIQHYALIRDRLGDYPVRFEIYPQSFNLKAALDAGAKRIGGCILADGSIGSRTAAVSEPYADLEGVGNLYRSDAFWDEFITSAHRRGLQVCVHCIGDAAIRQINDVYLKLRQTEPADLRHQLIHCEVTPNDLMDGITASGAVPVMQPLFDLLWGGDQGFYSARLGRRRARQMNRFAGFAKRGVRVCGSSDWYITELNAAKSIWAAINHHNPEERLSPREAISIYTENNAWLSHEEDSRGRIAEGFVADLSVLDADLTHPFDPDGVKVRSVIVGGEVVHAS
jgi:predicted amidohydrolase YtcJ